MGAAAETIQFNTRIERSLKLAGDDVLKRAGYSPSQAVRGQREGFVDRFALLARRFLEGAAGEEMDVLRRGRRMAERCASLHGFVEEFARCAMVWAKSQVIVEPDVRIDEEDRGGSVHGRTPSSPWRSSMNSSMSWS